MADIFLKKVSSLERTWDLVSHAYSWDTWKNCFLLSMNTTHQYYINQRHTTGVKFTPRLKIVGFQGVNCVHSKRRFLTGTATATLVSAFVLSKIDYCNSLLFGSTHDRTSHWQRIQNYAARVILCLPMSSSITIHLKSLHWLPVKVKSTYKIACLCYHCHSSSAPSYVTDMLHKKPLHTRNTRSSSYNMPLLNRPAHSKATLGDHSFSFASSSVWNSIPNDVRCAPPLSSFKSRLKTYLFCSCILFLYPSSLYICAWFGLVITLLMVFLRNALMCI